VHSIFQTISPAEKPVLSLEVQAKMASKEIVRMHRFVVLARHFFLRFFDNPLTSGDGENGARVIQVLSLVAVPGLVFALYLTPSYFIFPPNTAPRAYWPRVSDHYFYVMYASVITGAAAVFEWDLLFPDLIDILVLTPLPVPSRKFFGAKITALGLFLGLFLLASGCIGAAALPLIADEPSFFRYIMAHVLAITAGALFTSCFFIALQGVLLNFLGERIFRWVSPVLQGASLAALLIVLFLFPLLSQNLRLLLLSGNQAVRWFPPFWFLGLYQTLLEGASAPHVFHKLAEMGGLALLIVLALSFLSYPLAYRRKMRSAIEGKAVKNSRNWLTEAKDTLLHGVFVLRPSQRGVYHFISQTLKRAPHHRIYLSMYGGAGLALFIAITVGFREHSGQLNIVYSEHGLRAAIPITAFLAVSGFKVAFLSPVELKANWLFRAIGSKPDSDHITTTLRWTLLRCVFLTVAVLLLAKLLSPSAFPGMRQMMAQLLVAQGLCLLLIDALFLRFLSVPFTIPLVYSKRNLAFYIAAFLVLFSPFIWTVVDTGRWIEQSLWHFLTASLFVLVAHVWLQHWQKNVIRERSGLLEDEDAEEFPQRLGLF
jgi:hypothetical protein